MKWTIWLLLLFPLGIQAQLYGTVTGPDGEGLAFASVYLEGASKGTTANAAGNYSLPLDPGTYQVVFQYIGYTQQTQSVVIGQKAVLLDVQLQPQAFTLSEIEVRSGGEDPAYPVIRKAMEKRKFFLEQVSAYSCDVYIKGVVRLTDAPESIMGEEVGTLGGLLDSTGRGILYLSESESQYHFQQPNLRKEVMVSSKVSGNDNGFSFNSAAEMDFNLYEPVTDYGRPIVSPIAPAAFSYYRYRLEGTFYDEDGRLINKILVIPKNPEEPVYGGYLYIVEEIWNIHSAELFLTGASTNQPAVDTIFMKQVHVPVGEEGVWRIFNQVFRMKGNILGFKFDGTFTGVYRDYNFNPAFPKGFFGNEIFRVDEEANEKGAEYFDTIRPLPLTLEESVDYVRKDSLQTIRSSRPYLDSLDAVNNKFSPADLLLGYTYSNSFKRWSITAESPLNSVQFNTIQGWNGYLGLKFQQAFNEENTRRLDLVAKLSYGVADDRLRYLASGSFLFNRVQGTRITAEGGVWLENFDRQSSLTPTVNTLYTLYGRRNYAKLYEKQYAALVLETEPWNGIRFRLRAEGGWRQPVSNRTDYSFVKSDRAFTDNAPVFEGGRYAIAEAQVRLRVKQRYISYPKRKFILGSKWPDLELQYRKGLGGIDFDFWSVGLVQEGWDLGVVGRLSARAETGGFWRRDRTEFMDLRHFHGNQTIFGRSALYQQQFFLLPYFERSTDRPYLEAHIQHAFEGFLFDKIPGLKKLGLTEVIGAKYLYTQDGGHYWEFHAGIDQIGINLFRFLRVDFVAALEGGKFRRFGIVIGTNLPFE